MLATKAPAGVYWNQADGWDAGDSVGETINTDDIVITSVGTGFANRAIAASVGFNTVDGEDYRITFTVQRTLNQADAVLDVIYHRPSFGVVSLTVGNDVGDETSTSAETLTVDFTAGDSTAAFSFEGKSDSTIQKWPITNA